MNGSHDGPTPPQGALALLPFIARSPDMAVNRDQIPNKVKDLIVQSLGVNASEITLDSSFIDDLGADSLDIVELVMLIEKEFGIEIPDEDAEKISTVQDAVDYIVNHQS